MGTFLGHAFPGSLFLLFGLLWAVKYSLRFLGQKSKYSLQIKKVIQWMEFLEWGGMAFFSTLGAVLEQCTMDGPCFFRHYNKDTHKWLYLIRWQHSTMYIPFAIVGIVGLLTQCRFRIPVGLDYFLLHLAFFNEGLLFYTHTSRVSALDQYIHHIQLIPIFSGAACSLLEVQFRNNPILGLFRASMLITQGTWLWQIGFVLYPQWEAPSWDHNDQQTLSFMATCYCWHCQGAVLFISIIYGIVYWILRSRKGGFEGTENEIQKFNQDDTKTYTALLDGSDEE